MLPNLKVIFLVIIFSEDRVQFANVNFVPFLFMGHLEFKTVTEVAAAYTDCFLQGNVIL